MIFRPSRARPRWSGSAGGSVMTSRATQSRRPLRRRSHDTPGTAMGLGKHIGACPEAGRPAEGVLIVSHTAAFGCRIHVLGVSSSKNDFIGLENPAQHLERAPYASPPLFPAVALEMLVLEPLTQQLA